MFGKTTIKEIVKEEVNKKIETIIGASVKVEGDFSCDDVVTINGEVNGKVKTSDFLTVGSTAKIKADVKARDANIAGQINGNIFIDNCLEISETAIITGDIECRQIIIRQGAQINGQLKMLKLKNITDVAVEQKTNKETEKTNEMDVNLESQNKEVVIQSADLVIN